MAQKRTHPSLNSSSRKRSRLSQHDGPADDEDSPSAVNPRIDPTYGQRGAFPGLDDRGGGYGVEGEELFYGPASDGLEYLRMVR